MHIHKEESSDVILVTVEGDVETTTIKEFKTQLLAIAGSTSKDIEMDLTQVNYMDSSGIGVLVALLKLQNQKGKSFKITKINEKVKSVLVMSSLTNLLKV